MRKPRSDSRLDKLTLAQRNRLLGWLRQNMKYEAVVELMRRECGVKTSEGAVANFYSRNMQAILGQPMPEQASGIAVTITCRRPGEIKLAFFPLPPEDAAVAQNARQEEQATIQADGVEVVILSEGENQVRLGVFPKAAAGEQDQKHVP